MSDRPDTIAAIATPPGKSGIGIVRVSGKESLSIARKITNKNIKPRNAHFSSFKDGQGRLIDSGLTIFFNAPHSFTGEDVVEFQGHGGQVVMNLLLKEVLNHGARLARPGEFTERAYMNEKIDLVQAEAVADLINSVSEQAALSAVRSLEGEFSSQINGLVDGLVSIRVFVEGALDFPEEEIDFLKDSAVVENIENIIHKLNDLLLAAINGSKLRAGTRAVIIGRPNVGKSSLLNRLAGINRAIVTDVAGTTRDVIEDTIQIDGLSLNIVDTAGLREPEGIVEEEGVRRSLSEIEKADIVIFVTDALELNDEEVKMLGRHEIPPDKQIVLHNKIDLFKGQNKKKIKNTKNRIFVSTRTGEGMDLFRNELIDIAVQHESGENTILARERHIQALSQGKKIIDDAYARFKKSGQGEILAEELRRAQQKLGEITGEFHNEDLLGEIFSRFCIGK